MKGLLIKDFLNQKGQLKLYGIMVIAFFLMTIFNDSSNISVMGGYICILCTLLPVNAFAYDERCCWDRYALSMPISRKDLVLSKYLFILFISLIGILLNFSICVIKSMVNFESLIIIGVFWSLSIVITVIIIPIIIKLGTEKARIAMMALLVCPTLLAILVTKLNVPMPSTHVLSLLSTFAPILWILVTLLSFFISIKVSIYFYTKKEL